MQINYCHGKFIAILMAGLLSGCAGTEALVTAPSVSLTSVEVQKIGFEGQTFLLKFDVENANSFPLPIKEIRYSVLLGNQRFASGKTQCDFTIPARGDGKFAISVNLDLLNAGTELAAIIGGGVRDSVIYELDGSLTVDIPLLRPIRFSSTGTVAVQSVRF